MRKKCTRILFTILCIITILMSMMLPSGALGFDDNTAFGSSSDPGAIVDRYSMFTPFSVFQNLNTKPDYQASGDGYTGVAEYGFTNISMRDRMDPNGNVILARYYLYGSDNTVYPGYTYDAAFNITNYTEPTLLLPGSTTLLTTFRMTGGVPQSNSGTTRFLIRSGGYALNTSDLSSYNNIVSSVQFQDDPDVSNVTVTYDFEGYTNDTNLSDQSLRYSYTTSETSVIPVLPVTQLQVVLGVSDLYVTSCDLVISFNGADDNQYDLQGIFTLYGGGLTSYYLSNTGFFNSVKSVLNNKYSEGFSDGYDSGYDIGLGENSQAAYLEGVQDGYADGTRDGLVEGEVIGYDKGYLAGQDQALSNLNFSGFIGAAVGGFLNAPLFGPNFTIGGILAVLVAFTLVIAFLKYFAGG